MARPKTTSITLDASALEAKVAEVTKLDESIAKTKGTAAARRNKATETVNAAPFYGVGDTFADIIDTLEQALATAKNHRDELVTALVKSQATYGALTALIAKRDALVTETVALATVLKSAGVDVTVPTFAKVKATLGSSTASVTTKNGRFIRHGEKGDEAIAESNNSLSGVAWYWFGQCGVDALKSALASVGITNIGTGFGPVTLTIKSKKGADITTSFSYVVTAKDEAPTAE